MCGIAGFQGPLNTTALDRMTDQMILRGPDGRGTFVDAESGLHLGHRRLSILDHAGGHQPLWSRDGQLAVIFNGEIYNHGPLRSELEALGHVFRTDHSDTEVLLYGYRQWGEDFVKKLNGMWAFALFDRARRQLLLSRDRFGKKPLYYYASPGLFAFASQLDALTRHPGVDRQVSRTSLLKYFAYGYIPAPGSIYLNIYKLPGGHSLCLNLDTGARRTWAYWTHRIEPEPLRRGQTIQSLAGELESLIEEAVRTRLVADVPVGIFLSGGLDSSAVAAMARRHINDLHTFCIGFTESTYDESPFAAAVAEHLGTSHHLRILDGKELGLIRQTIVSGLDEPMGDSSLLPTCLLSAFARESVTVALGGDGGDELFAGYDTFRALRPTEMVERWIPGPIHTAIRKLVNILPTSRRSMNFLFRLRRFLRGLAFPSAYRAPVWQATVEPEELADLLDGPVDLEEVFAEAIECWQESANLDEPLRLMQFYTKIYMQDSVLTKVDRASMLNSLEVRAPLLDVNVVDFVRKLPYDLRFRAGRGKFLLKEAFRTALPAAIVDRSKKGFASPVSAWFYSGELALDQPSPLLNRPAVDRFLRTHRAGRADYGQALWNMYLLNAWLAREGPLRKD
ncbi:MAG: asparagine synthase (glutamine-hydrolyzing) [Spirochaetales bacterium]|nr:asparagine synthase (glutamine-hydrolyzing) [Spirochaetales bacterium]